MKHYLFKVELSGYGDNPDEAWDDAVEGFNQEAGATPEEYTVEEDVTQLPESICQDGTIAIREETKNANN